MSDEISKIINRANRQNQSSEAQIDRFLLSLEKFLDRNLDDLLGRVVSGEVKGIEAVNILSQIFTSLESQGLSAEVGKLKTIYSQELRFIRDEFEELGFKNPLTTADAQLTQALIDNRAKIVSNQVERYGLNIQELLTQQIITGDKPNYKELKEDFGSRVASNIKTELDTATMALNRGLNAKKAEELGLYLFLYVGAKDNITRPFCRKLLSKSPPIYTRDEIAAMDNEQDLEVINFGGGYNCRHHWRPLSLELANKMGYSG
jgi:hypothetical protein